MTHDELLAKINAWEYSDYQAMGTSAEWPYKIIRAVVELHKPMYYDTHPTLQCPCGHCEHREWDVWPCPTIQKIMDELR